MSHCRPFSQSRRVRPPDRPILCNGLEMLPLSEGKPLAAYFTRVRSWVLGSIFPMLFGPQLFLVTALMRPKSRTAGLR